VIETLAAMTEPEPDEPAPAEEQGELTPDA
jgi:hypothetical protein